MSGSIRILATAVAATLAIAAAPGAQAQDENWSFDLGSYLLADPIRPHVACLLVDIQLAGMSGLELHARLASQEIHTPVIFITAHDDPAPSAEAIKRGCAGYFRKTDPGAQIIEAIRGAVPAVALPSAP